MERQQLFGFQCAYIPPRNEEYLFVLLHNRGEEESSLLTVVERINSNVGVLSVAGDIYDEAGFSYFSRSGDAIDAERFDAEVGRIQDFIYRALKHFNQENTKIILMGEGDGAVVAAALSAREPSRYAGVVAMYPAYALALHGNLGELPVLCLVSEDEEDGGSGMRLAENLSNANALVGVVKGRRKHGLSPADIASIKVWAKNHFPFYVSVQALDGTSFEGAPSAFKRMLAMIVRGVFPLYDDDSAVIRRPVVTWVLILLNIGMFLFMNSPAISPQVYEYFGLSRYNVGQLFPLATHLFAHANWGHLLGNMLFLFVFGNNIEASFGRLRYIALYLAAGLISSGLFLSIMSHGMLIGASGAISGLLGAYLYLYPKNKISILLFFFWRLEISARWYLGGWIVLQIFYAMVFQSISNIAFAAHVSGFFVGMLLTAIWLAGKKIYRIKLKNFV